MTVHKTITMWSKFSAAWTVDFAELKQVNIRTARCAGLVHAVRGPTLDPKEDTYTVSLAPIGLQRGDAQPCNEQQAASAAHGLLHGLAALHKVRHSFLEINEGVLFAGSTAGCLVHDSSAAAQSHNSSGCNMVHSITLIPEVSAPH